jgi:hypothetical protein
MNKNFVLKQVEEKLSPTIKNLENGNVSEHDIFPSLLWLLLENSKDFEKQADVTKAKLLEDIYNSKVDIKALLSNHLSQILESNTVIEKSVMTTKSDLLEQNNELKQVLREDTKIIFMQENQKTLSLLKWVIGLCIVQFIGLVALFSIIFMR